MNDVVVYEEIGAGSRPVTADQLSGFFEGWPLPPAASALLAVLEGSHCSFLARTDDGRVIGIVSAISDGILSAYIPLLEVLPGFRGRGIGSRLTSLMLARLEGLYMVDLSCDEGLVPFYRRFGMEEIRGMGVRDPNAIPQI